jgi:hypothetical protein
MADSDIKLVPNQVIVQAWDLCLDSGDAERRKEPTAMRRALVHDFNDGLTMNWDNDYGGGVTINGLHTIDAEYKKTTQPGAKPLMPRSPGAADLAIIGNVEFHGKLKIKPMVPTPSQPEGPVSAGLQHTMITALGATPAVQEIDVFDEISRLQQEVAALKQALAGQLNWRWCNKCQGLFFAGNPSKGVCPKDGKEHSSDGSGNYNLLHQ